MTSKGDAKPPPEAWFVIRDLQGPRQIVFPKQTTHWTVRVYGAFLDLRAWLRQHGFRGLDFVTSPLVSAGRWLSKNHQEKW